MKNLSNQWLSFIRVDKIPRIFQGPRALVDREQRMSATGSGRRGAMGVALVWDRRFSFSTVSEESL